MEETNCQSGLRSNIINKEVFEREAELCRKLHKENNGKCCWGSCDSCGVIPCLYKLYKGEVIDEKDKVNAPKERFLKSE
jgi:hypothetical protein